MLKIGNLSAEHATVRDCPHTRKSNGVIYLEPELIAQLSAAVYDKDEWAIVLLGTREEDGWVVKINDYIIPAQTREAAHVKIHEMDDQPPEMVTVVHSHHGMDAKFSITDDRELNPRFPSSIVIAQDKRTYLGFDYEACGKVKLPCGATGMVEFFIQPTVGPIVAKMNKVIHNGTNLGDCTRSENTADQFHVQYRGACGLSEKEVNLRAGAFGRSDKLFAEVFKLPRPQKFTSNINVTDKRHSAKNPDKDTKQELKKENTGGIIKPWWDGLFGHTSYPFVNTQLPQEQKQKEEAEEEKVTDVYQCEVCGDYNAFTNWECENCFIGEYCLPCAVGHHRAVVCPKAS